MQILCDCTSVDFDFIVLFIVLPFLFLFYFDFLHFDAKFVKYVLVTFVFKDTNSVQSKSLIIIV